MQRDRKREGLRVCRAAWLIGVSGREYRELEQLEEVERPEEDDRRPRHERRYGDHGPAETSPTRAPVSRGFRPRAVGIPRDGPKLRQQ